METSIESGFIGKYVIVRSNMSGVLFGKLVAKEGLELSLEDVRKIYYWKGANTVEDIAEKGISHKDSQVTIVVPKMIISEYVQLIPTSALSEENLKSAPIWKAE